MLTIVMMRTAALQFRWVCRRPPALLGLNPDAALPCVGPDQTMMIKMMTMMTLMSIILMMNIIVVIIIGDCINGTVDKGLCNNQGDDLKAHP